MFYQCITPYNPFQRAVTLLIMPVIGWTLSVFIVDLNSVDHIRIIIVKDILCIMCMHSTNYLSIAQTRQGKKTITTSGCGRTRNLTPYRKLLFSVGAHTSDLPYMLIDS